MYCKTKTNRMIGELWNAVPNDTEIKVNDVDTEK